jgi:hypothetical protein
MIRLNAQDCSELHMPVPAAVLHRRFELGFRLLTVFHIVPKQDLRRVLLQGSYDSMDQEERFECITSANPVSSMTGLEQEHYADR